MDNTQIDICNLALLAAGSAEAIMNLDGVGIPAKCRLLYGPCLQEVLAQIDWTCATGRRQLNRVADAPAFGYRRQYQLPADHIKTRTILLDRADMQWKEEGKSIVTDSETCFCIYTRLLADPGMYPPIMVRYLVAEMGSRLATYFGNNQRAQTLQEEIRLLIIPDARRQTASGRQQNTAGEPLWTDV